MEQWRTVVEDDRYEVSDMGQVRSYAVRGNSGARASMPRLLARTLSTEGYPVVSLGNRRQRKVHRLMLEAFVGPCPPGYYGCHNNGDPSDCRLENLRWDSPAGNCADEVLHGTSNRGERNNTAKLTEGDVRAIRDSTEPHTVLAAEYGVTPGAIRHVRSGLTWRHVA